MCMHMERNPQVNLIWLLVSSFVQTLRSLPSGRGPDPTDTSMGYSLNVPPGLGVMKNTTIELVRGCNREFDEPFGLWGKGRRSERAGDSRSQAS